MLGLPAQPTTHWRLLADGCAQGRVKALIAASQDPVRATTWPHGSPGEDPATLHALNDGKRDSKCDFSDCYSCFSREQGGIEKCICRSDSTFDLSRTKFSDGTKSYIMKLRAFHKANPNVASLKGVKFGGSNKPMVLSLMAEGAGTMTVDDLFNQDPQSFEAFLASFDNGDSMMCLSDDRVPLADARPVALPPKPAYRALLSSPVTLPLSRAVPASADLLTTDVVRFKPRTKPLPEPDTVGGGARGNVSPVPMAPLSTGEDVKILKVVAERRGYVFSALQALVVSARFKWTELNGFRRVLIIMIALRLALDLAKCANTKVRVMSLKMLATVMQHLKNVRALVPVLRRRLTTAANAA